MVRMLIVGYSFGIRSERRLCEEVHLNLAYRWFCRLGLEDAVPDHSTFSKNRHGRFRESEAFRQVFESVVERCMKEGLVGGEGFAVDASLVKADANRSRSTAREEAGGPARSAARDSGRARVSGRPGCAGGAGHRSRVDLADRSRGTVDGGGWPGVLRLFDQLSG